MDKEFFTKPRFIALAVIVLAFFMPFVSVGDTNSKFKASGMQLTYGGGGFSAPGKAKASAAFAAMEAIAVAMTYKASGLGFIDKLAFLIFAGAGLLLFGMYKKHNKEEFFLDDDKVKIV